MIYQMVKKDMNQQYSFLLGKRLAPSLMMHESPNGSNNPCSSHPTMEINKAYRVTQGLVTFNPHGGSNE